eukprot:m.57077 g.57077  ORF g.57077 m.57077 type:complete len:1100 (+) comp11078_c0_seq1:154-3453(+)
MESLITRYRMGPTTGLKVFMLVAATLTHADGSGQKEYSSLVVVVDNSASMGSDTIDLSRTTAENLISAVIKAKRSMIVSAVFYGTDANIVINRESSLPVMKTLITNSTKEILGTKTNTSNALKLVSEELLPQPGTLGALVLISDGLCLDSASVQEAVADNLKSKGFDLFAWHTPPSQDSFTNSIFNDMGLADLERLVKVNNDSHQQYMLQLSSNEEENSEMIAEFIPTLAYKTPLNTPPPMLLAAKASKANTIRLRFSKAIVSTALGAILLKLDTEDTSEENNLELISSLVSPTEEKGHFVEILLSSEDLLSWQQLHAYDFAADVDQVVFIHLMAGAVVDKKGIANEDTLMRVDIRFVPSGTGPTFSGSGSGSGLLSTSSKANTEATSTNMISTTSVASSMSTTVTMSTEYSSSISSISGSSSSTAPTDSTTESSSSTSQGLKSSATSIPASTAVETSVSTAPSTVLTSSPDSTLTLGPASSSASSFTTAVDTTSLTAVDTTSFATATASPVSSSAANTDPPDAFLVYFDFLPSPAAPVRPMVKLVFSAAVLPTGVMAGAIRIQSSRTSADNSIIVQGTAVENEEPMKNILLVTFSDEDVDNLKQAEGLARSQESTYLSLIPDKIDTASGGYVAPLLDTAAMAARFYYLEDSFFQEQNTTVDSGNVVGKSTTQSPRQPPVVRAIALNMTSGEIILNFINPVNRFTLQLDKIRLMSSIFGMAYRFTDDSGTITSMNRTDSVRVVLTSQTMNEIKARDALATSKETSYFAADSDFVRDFVGTPSEGFSASQVSVYVADLGSPVLFAFQLDLSLGIMHFSFSEPVDRLVYFDNIQLQNKASNPNVVYRLSDGFLSGSLLSKYKEGVVRRSTSQLQAGMSYVNVDLSMSVYDVDQIRALEGLAESTDTTYLSLSNPSFSDKAGNPVVQISSSDAMEASALMSKADSTQSDPKFSSATKILIAIATSCILCFIFILTFIAPRWTSHQKYSPQGWKHGGMSPSHVINDLEWDAQVDPRRASEQLVARNDQNAEFHVVNLPLPAETELANTKETQIHVVDLPITSEAEMSHLQSQLDMDLEVSLRDSDVENGYIETDDNATQDEHA